MNIFTRIESVRIFVASTPSEWLPLKVLEYSIRLHSSLDVEVYPIYEYKKAVPIPKNSRNKARTPFSYQRFLIPEICDYQGKAIYLDSDMLVFSDISRIWNANFEGHQLLTVGDTLNGRKSQFSVMLLNCDALGWNIENIIDSMDSGLLSYQELMYEMSIVESIGYGLPPEWNCLERFDQSTCLLHYTDMHTQPWISAENKLGHLWMQTLKSAINADFISHVDLEREISLGHVRPSLVAQLDAGIDLSADLPPAICKLDKGFLAPYKRLGPSKWKKLVDKIESVKKILNVSS